MGESLNKIHEELISRLYKPLIFYIPRKFWLELDSEKWNDTKFDQVFDTVVLIKSDGSNQILNSDPSNYYILAKTVELNKCTFKLLDMKSRLNKSSFKFLIENYCQYIFFYRRISTWMLENVQNDIKSINKETLLSFEIQKKAFDKHWNYVNENFVSIAKMKQDRFNSKLTSKDFKTINALINNPSETNFDKLSKSKKYKKEKKILITEQEAEDFLLKTVFNIKL